MVAFVTVNFNSGQVLIDTLTSLFANLPAKYKNHVWLVDNGSQDGSTDKAVEKFPQLRVIKSQKNLGFGQGNNLALTEILREKEYEFACLFNPDLTFTPGWLDEMLRVAKLDKKIAAVNPLIVYSDKFDVYQLQSSNPDIYYHFTDYRTLAGEVGNFAVKTNELTVQGRQYVKTENNECEVYFVTAEPWLEFSVYDEKLTGYEITLAGRQFTSNPTGALFKKINYKLSGNLDLKVKNYTLDLTHNGKLESKIEVVNSLGSGFKAGAQLPDNHYYGRRASEVPTTEFEVELWHGACALLRTEALHKVGMFDPNFFLYYEESDLAMRMREGGFSTYAAPKSKVYHRERGSRSDKTIEFMQAGQKRFIDKWKGRTFK